MSGHDLDATLPGPLVVGRAIPPMSPVGIDRVRRLEQVTSALPQVPIVTRHVIHAGMYARTVRVPAGVVLTGAFIKRATLVIVSGHCRVNTDDGSAELAGYHVLPASAGRKQAFVALDDTHITMLFPTASKTVEECEHEFTDEADRLFSRTGENEIVITGE